MDDLKELSSHLHTWLDRYRRAAKVAPLVQEAVEDVDWQINMLESRPNEAYGVSSTHIDERARFAFQSVVRLLPEMPEYGSATDLRINSLTTSSTSSANDYISHVAALGTPPAVEWARHAQESYVVLQAAHHRPGRVRELLAARFPTVVARFDVAVSAYQQARLNVGQQSAAALEMRNVLDATQGELFARARRAPRENMTWADMCERLATGPTAATLLLNEEVGRSALYSDLSTVAKRRGSGLIEGLWSRTLDHLYVVLAETQ